MFVEGDEQAATEAHTAEVQRRLKNNEDVGETV